MNASSNTPARQGAKLPVRVPPVWKKDGMDPEVIAEMTGYDSAEDMIRDAMLLIQASDEDEPVSPAGNEVALRRLNNVLKHARASRVRLVTRHHGSYVEIRVEDDGEGFDAANAQRGRGLKSQQRRARHLGGHVRIDTSPGHGTRLSLRLPVIRKELPSQQDSG